MYNTSLLKFLNHLLQFYCHFSRLAPWIC